MIQNLRRADQARSGTTDVTRTERGIHTAENRETAGQWLFRWAGMGSLYNRRLSLRWFEPNTCHHLQKRPVAWAYPGSRAALLLSRCVSRCAAVSRCIAVITDIWRAESGRSERFAEPLAPSFRPGIQATLGGSACPVAEAVNDLRSGPRIAHGPGRPGGLSALGNWDARRARQRSAAAVEGRADHSAAACMARHPCARWNAGAG